MFKSQSHDDRTQLGRSESESISLREFVIGHKLSIVKDIFYRSN